MFAAPLAALFLAAVDAPITAVTVYSQDARVTRTAPLKLDGASRIELPLLPSSVDSASIRLESSDAEVRHIELTRVDESAFPKDEARSLLDELDKLDDSIHQTERERDASQGLLHVVEGLRPAAPEDVAGRPAPRLDPSGWAASLSFVGSWSEKLQAQVRAANAKLEELQRQRAPLQARAAQLAAQRRGGWRVAATVSGHGSATLRLSYLVIGASWRPEYDLALDPASGRVQVDLAGQVTQSTGEDWADAALTLSTALPVRMSKMPELLSWKIGERERFIPMPRPVIANVRPTPPCPPLLGARDEIEELRQALASRAGSASTPRSQSTSAPTIAQEERPTNAPATTGRISGKVLDAATNAPVADVVVSATSPALQGEQTVVTDASGEFELPTLPPGVYQLHIEREAYKPLNQPNVRVRPDRTVRVNLPLIPDRTLVSEAEIIAKPPTVDTGSTQAGATITDDFLNNVPIAQPNSAGGAVRSFESIALMAPTTNEDALGVDGLPGPNFGPSSPTHNENVGLAPPPGYAPPPLKANTAAALAGGYNLSFRALRPESLRSGGGTRRVALYATRWSVDLERQLFPAKTSEAYLTAQLKSPEKQTLPGGEAHLFVGADPAGVAQLKVMAPGEGFSLPLGLDRGLKPIRNVKLVQTEKGLFSKDDVTEYAVTIELANPYPTPVNVRIFDQWPLSADEHVKTELLSTEPYAVQDATKGKLEWRVTLPASGKSQVAYRFRIRRPKNYRLSQNP